MHKKTLSRPLICSLLLALPLSVGCVAEYHHDGEPPCDDPSDPNDDNDDDGNCPDPADSIYLGTDRALCDGITFSCPDDYTPFDAACGCGCEPIPQGGQPVCPEEGEGVTFLSRDLKVCNSITFTCPDGSASFNAACGCGCVASSTTSDPDPTPTCPDAEDPKVHYLGDPGSAQCTMVTFQCPAECVTFNDDCGCGCIEP